MAELQATGEAVAPPAAPSKSTATAKALKDAVELPSGTSNLPIGRAFESLQRFVPEDTPPEKNPFHPGYQDVVPYVPPTCLLCGHPRSFGCPVVTCQTQFDGYYSCGKVFHHACAGIKTQSLREGDWTCKDCSKLSCPEEEFGLEGMILAYPSAGEDAEEEALDDSAEADDKELEQPGDDEEEDDNSFVDNDVKDRDFLPSNSEDDDDSLGDLDKKPKAKSSSAVARRGTSSASAAAKSKDTSSNAASSKALRRSPRSASAATLPVEKDPEQAESSDEEEQPKEKKAPRESKRKRKYQSLVDYGDVRARKGDIGAGEAPHNPRQQMGNKVMIKVSYDVALQSFGFN